MAEGSVSPALINDRLALLARRVGSAADLARVDAFAQGDRRADTAISGGCAVQCGAGTQAHRRFDTGTMTCEQEANARILEPFRRPRERRIAGLVEVKAANDREHRTGQAHRASVVEQIDDARVAASGDEGMCISFPESNATQCGSA